MRTLFLTALLGSALLACTVETKSSNPAPAADGGVTGTGDKGGVKSSPIKTPSTSKDAGATTQDPDPTPAPGAPTTCKGAVECLSECADGDDACQEGCMSSLPSGELNELVELGDCINDSGCDTDECVADVCATPIDVCLGN